MTDAKDVNNIDDI